MKPWFSLPAALLIPLLAQAQTWPAKPVQWLVPFAAGGSSDNAVRVVAEKLGPQLGQPVVVINRPGANGDIAAEAVAASAPDGQTLFLTVPSLVTNAFYFKSSVDPARLAPVIQMTAGAYLLLSSAKFTGRSIGEIIQMVRAKPGSVTCAATGGQGTIACEMLKYHAKADMLLVPYKGSAPALTAAMAGEIDLLFNFSNTADAQVRAGRVRAIATTAAKRGGMPLPELPAIAETLQDFEVLGWHGVSVARATPRELILRINREFNQAIANPDVRAKFAEGGLDAVGGSPEVMETRLRAEHNRYGAVLKAAGVMPQ